MTFKVLNSLPTTVSPNTAYLILDSWDDWFEFNTQYHLYFDDENNERYSIGYIKIGQFNMINKQSRAELPKTFESLTDDFFSLGQDDSFYKKLNNLNNDKGNHILQSLNDVALNHELFNRALNERVTRVSLLRSVSQSSILGQFHRLANGDASLTNYEFKYIAPRIKNKNIPNIELDFNVVPESNPPSNVHVLIGRNGVGKTHLLNNMLDALISKESVTKHGVFESNEDILFANLVSVTFSAFDESEPIKEKKDKTKGIQYSYIGLKRVKEGKDKDSLPKSPTMLKNEFIKSLEKCQKGVKKERWKQAIEILESDPMFKESEIIIAIDEDNINSADSKASKVFKKLSSGHKIILLTITRLVETVEERSLILLDEPESHLHPPLLSAFIRSLSNLLIQRNGVAIIATHSPVILQEVSRSCVWKLRRTGLESIVERPERETFGENVGQLTQEVFGLEVTDSGFYNLIKKSVDNNLTYDSVKSDFNEQLGMEAKMIARTLMSIKNR